MDKEMIISSVKKTNRALVVHEDKVHGGFGGEISSIIMEEAFEWLDSPVRRVGSTFTPVGFNRILEKAILPDTKRIYDAALDLLKY
jgi:2-oxoisovalerate dehydrogenase E1 component